MHRFLCVALLVGLLAPPSGAALDARASNASASPHGPAPSAVRPFAEPPVTVRWDVNLETTGLLLALAFDAYGHPGFSLPVAERAQKDLAPFREHSAVAAVPQVLAALGIDGYAGLALRAAPFNAPEAGTLRTPLPEGWALALGNNDPAAGHAVAADVLQAFAAFYREANIGAFLDAHRAAYARAEAEVRRLVPSAADIAAMETYFGERLNSYTILPSLTHPPHGNVGLALDCPEAAPAQSPGCRDALFLLGTFVSVPPADVQAGTAAGFFDPAHPDRSRRQVHDLVVHEFGHAFINPYLEADAVRAAIDRHAHLMLPPLAERMAPQAYRAWSAVAIEHVVRTAEVRVAATTGPADRAARLRRTYVHDRAFVYLPTLEAAARRYDREGPQGTGRYATFGAFVPELVNAFARVDTLAAYEALGIGFGAKRAVTIQVTGDVPAGDTVFVTGGHAAVGDWDPRGAALTAGPEGRWTRTVAIEAGTRLAYKITRGSWPTEAARPDGQPRSNALLTVRRDTTVTIHVDRWLDGKEGRGIR